MAYEQTQLSLTPWTPTPTQIPLEWQTFITKETEIGSNYMSDERRVGDLLCSWGLPWPVVVAGYLLSFGEEVLYRANLQSATEVLEHHRNAIEYIDNIDDDDLLTLLNPSYEDLGALLIAIAFHYLDLLKQSKGHAYIQKDVVQIEQIGSTLLSLVKRLGMWSFKRALEDLLLQLCHPQQFLADAQQHQSIRQQDLSKLDEICQLFIRYYRETTQNPVMVTYTICGTAGLRRRQQDAHTTVTSEKTQLTGFDLATFDILVPTVSDCYAALGVFNQLGYIQDQLTDHIANPKPNGYSHIALGLVLNTQEPHLQYVPWLRNGSYICQIQISTQVMQAITNYGCLYPSCYHLYTKALQQEQEPLLSSYQVWQSKEGRVLETIKAAIIADHSQQQANAPIIVYDKKRKPVSLPKGATVLDFAFARDREGGEYAVEGFVNNRKALLAQVLDAGDIVDIRMSKTKQIRNDWLQKVTTPLARGAIQKHLMLDHKAHELLNPILERSSYWLTRDELYDELNYVLKQYHLGSMRTYLDKLDAGTTLQDTPEWAAQRIMQQISERNEATPSSTRWIPEIDMPIAKTYSSLHFCGRCKPKPAKDIRIVGYLKKQSHELVVHRHTCPNITLHQDMSEPVPMRWQLRFSQFRVGFLVEAQERDGLILDITGCLRRYHCSLRSIEAEVANNVDGYVRFTIESHDEKEILDIWQALSKIPGILNVEMNQAVTPTATYRRLQTLLANYTSLQEHTIDDVLWNDTKRNLKLRKTVLSNPFNISRPPLGDMFFGRTHEMKRMQRILCDGERGKALILYGPLRSGKSTLCRNFLERYVHLPFWHVYYSFFQAVGQNEETILMEIAERISDAFYEQLGQMPRLWNTYNHLDPQTRFRQFIQGCLTQVPGSRLVLALDEFGGALESYEKETLEYRFFPYWKDLVDEIPQLSLILALPTSAHAQLSSAKFNNLFSFAESFSIEFLDRESAERLLTIPLKAQEIVMHPSAVSQTTTLTGCNPYYTALIGLHLFDYLNQETHKQHVTKEDITLIVSEIMKVGSNHNFNLYRQEIQNTDELQILRTFIDLTIVTQQSALSLKKLADTLSTQTNSIRPHMERLRNGLILQEENGESRNPRYAFRIELLRQWLTRNEWFFNK